MLRAKFGAHEVITTIMLNFIVLAFLSWTMSTRLRVPETLHTRAVRAGALPRLDSWLASFHGSAANASIVIVLLATMLIDWYLFRTRGGFDLRAVGLQPDAAENAGINVGRTWIRALTISGALAGLGGINFVLGYEHYYEEGFATGAGFLGIAVALVGPQQSRSAWCSRRSSSRRSRRAGSRSMRSCPSRWWMCCRGS